MNVLLLTEAFPPAPVVGSFRAYKVARAFRDEGHQVHVITMSGGGVEAEGEYEPGISWQRIDPWPGPRQGYLALRRVLRGRRGDKEEAVGAAKSRPAEYPAGGDPAGNSIRRIVAGLITMPDDRQGVIPAVLRSIWSRRGSIDLLYSTAPSFSVHLAARAARVFIDVPWYAELRDPWIGNAARKYQAPALRSLDVWLERFCLRDASGIVLVTPRAAEDYRNRYAGLGPSVLVALNGIDEIVERPTQRHNEPLRIVYAGSVYPPRNPEPLVRALGEELKANPEVSAEFLFVGACGWHEAPGLEDAVRRLPPGSFATRLEWLPQEAARRIIAEADLLLLPAQQWVLQIPNKLYDYLGSRVPILAIAEPGSDTADMLTQACGHYVVAPGATAGELQAAARNALQAAATGGSVGRPEVLSSWLAKEQLAVLVRDITGRPSVFHRREACAHTKVSQGIACSAASPLVRPRSIQGEVGSDGA